MSDLKPIQPTSYDLLARTVQQLAALNQGVDEVHNAQIETAKALLALITELKPQGVRQIKVVDINMPFWALAGFLVKLALASIPAYIFLGAIAAGVVMFLGACTAALGS